MFGEMYPNSSSRSSSSSGHDGGGGAPMSPRISFSTDFVESPSSSVRYERDPKSVSTDFEFSVTSRSSPFQMSADELFFKGKILPLKKDHPLQKPTVATSATTTLRDELQSGDGDGVSARALSSLKGRWKGLLGLRKAHTASKKADSTSFKLGVVREEGGSSGEDLDT